LFIARPAEAAVPVADALPACTVITDGPTMRATAPMRATVVTFYRERRLLPATIVKNRAWVVDVNLHRKGTHYCLNPDGTTSGYSGNVPLSATQAVMVYVRHQPYAATEAPANYLTLARSPGHAWRVVGEDTAP
jgi:hypothetical protein